MWFRSQKWSVKAVFALTVGVLLIILLFRTGHAQSPESKEGAWSKPKLLFEDTGGFMRQDHMLADVTGTVHFFWSYNPHSPYDRTNNYNETETEIYYQGLRQGIWLDAHDILLHSQARMPFSLSIDPQGILHMLTIIKGPPCMAHLYVPVQQVGNTRAWSQPRCLESSGVGAPALAVDQAGVLYALYAQTGQETMALIKSSDEGRSWSFPAQVAMTSNKEVFVGFPKLVMDAKRRLHATWGEVQAPNGYPWRRIMYSRSLDGGTSWSAPLELAGDRQGEQNLAVYGDTVHVVWNGDAGYKGRYYRSSSDGGLTWSPRKTLPLPKHTGGLQGAPAIVVDSTGTAHILYTDSPTLYYITRRGDQWSQPVLIAGPENTGATSEIDVAMLAITEGNQLHALYTRDAQAVYYQHRAIDAPYKAPVPWPSSANELPTETPSPTTSPVPTATPQIRPTVPVSSDSVQPASNSMLSPILAGIFLSLVLVVGVMSVHLARPRH